MNPIMDSTDIVYTAWISQRPQWLPRRKLIICLLLALLPFFAAQAQIGARQPVTRALAIGISDYKNSDLRLNYADRDALAYADYLQSPVGGNVPPENIRLLLNEEATKTNIIKALMWWVNESQKGDRAIFYFSGHGDIENLTIKNHGFLLAYDVGMANYWDSGALNISMLNDFIETLTAKGVKTVLISDACRAGKLSGGTMEGAQATALRMKEALESEVKLLSCQPDQLSQESDHFGRGLFSFFLEQGLKGMADGELGSKDEVVDLSELMVYLMREVRKAASPKDQVPLVKGDMSAQMAIVNTDTLQAVAARWERVRNGTYTELLASAGKGNPADTITNPLHRKFREALDEGRLLYPEENSALHFYQQMAKEPALAQAADNARRGLAAALQEAPQQTIDDYLVAAPEEMSRRWNYDERFRQFPLYLDKAAELMGEGHVLYPAVKVRATYFRGLNLRLKGEQHKQGDALFRMALRENEQALALDSLSPFAYNEMGLLYRRLGQFEQSLEYFDKALHLSPKWVLPIINAGSSYYDAKNYEEAENWYRRALEIRPDFVISQYSMGLLYNRKGNYEKARTHLKKAMELDKNYLETYFTLADTYYEMDSSEQAISLLLHYVEEKPEKGRAWNLLGLSAKKMKDYDKADLYYSQAIAAQPALTDPYYNLGNLHIFTLENFEKAKGYFQDYLALQPNDPDALIRLACAQAALGEKDEALASIEGALLHGYSSISDIRETSYFVNNLGDDPRFEALLKRFEQ